MARQAGTSGKQASAKPAAMEPERTPVRAKSGDAFRTIGEVSDELDVPKHVLRFWEGKFPQLKPMKRGGGRRFYRPEDVTLLRGIHKLLHASGYTIKGVQRILREQGVDAVKAATLGGGTATAAASPAQVRTGKRGAAKASGLSPDLSAELQQVLVEVEAALSLARGQPASAVGEGAGNAAKAKRA